RGRPGRISGARATSVTPASQGRRPRTDRGGSSISGRASAPRRSRRWAWRTSGRLHCVRELLLAELLHDLGAAEILREVVDLDHVLAQRFLALPLSELIGRNNFICQS